MSLVKKQLLLPSSSPRRLHDALLILGFKFSRREVNLLDRDYLLHDVRLVFRAKVKEVHPDHGGDPATARTLVEAYKVIRRICAPQAFFVPKATPWVKKGPHKWTEKERKEHGEKVKRTLREKKTRASQL